MGSIDAEKIEEVREKFLSIDKDKKGELSLQDLLDSGSVLADTSSKAAQGETAQVESAIEMPPKEFVLLPREEEEGEEEVADGSPLDM